MFQAGRRRIKRSVFIDSSSIRFLDDELYDRLYRVEILRPYLESRKNEIDVSEPVNGRRMTNIGTFRAYLTAFLRDHPGTNKDTIIMVNYESLQSDIFDHFFCLHAPLRAKALPEPVGERREGTRRSLCERQDFRSASFNRRLLHNQQLRGWTA